MYKSVPVVCNISIREEILDNTRKHDNDFISYLKIRIARGYVSLCVRESIYYRRNETIDVTGQPYINAEWIFSKVFRRPYAPM